jgi:zinc protease
VQVWVKTGSIHEGDYLGAGLSHYLEHMLFKGTPTRPPGSIDTEIEGLGGNSNAFTSYDFTHYDLVVPLSGLRAAAALLADIAVNAAFVPAELESEKKVVFEEMNLTEDDPERFLQRRLTEAAYPAHPYGRPLLGTREFVKNLTRETLNAYYKKHYVPANMVLVVVGAVTPAQARDVAAETFGRLTGPAPVRPAVGPPTRRGAPQDVRRSERQAYLGIAWHAAPTGNTDIYAVDLLTYILGDGPSSRLNQVLREIVRRVRDEGVTSAERERAITTAESSYAFDIETVEGLAKAYGQAETTWTLQDEVHYLERVRRVSAEQIRAAARTYFGDDNYVRVRFLPEGAR